jgi:hypothetical protein
VVTRVWVVVVMAEARVTRAKRGLRRVSAHWLLLAGRPTRWFQKVTLLEGERAVTR